MDININFPEVFHCHFYCYDFHYYKQYLLIHWMWRIEHMDQHALLTMRQQKLKAVNIRLCGIA